MRYDIFLMPLLVAFAISMTLLIVLILLNKKKMFFDGGRIGERHLHKKNISRLGGVAIILAFMIAIFFDNRLVINQSLMGILIVSALILIFGVIDDVKQLSWTRQLLFQVLVVIFLFAIGVRLEYITNPFGGIILFQGFLGYGFSLFFSIIWIVFIMNAMNWIDGVDGASGGVAFIGAVTIFILSLRPEINQPPVAIITSAFLGALGAFLFFNFYPAKILAGTSGSMFMGFVVAILAIFAGAKIATTLLVLAVPIIDAFWVIGQRFKSGHSVFLPDKKHLHFRLMEIGWSVKKICFFYYSITILIAVVALNTRELGKIFAFVLVAIIMFVTYAWTNTQTKKVL